MSHDHFLFKSSTTGRFPLKLPCLLKDLFVLFVWICFTAGKYLWSSRREILQFQWQFQRETAWCAGFKQKVTVRQKPSSLYDSVWSYASVALVRIDFRPETSEKYAPPCIPRLDKDNCLQVFLNLIFGIFD